MEEKIDFKIKLKHLYTASGKDFTVVDVPPMQYLMVDGHGDPNRAPEYRQAVEALYTISYGLKNLSKKRLGRDWVVAPLEGLWWTPDMALFSVDDKDSWDWTMMILQPEWVQAALLTEAVQEASKKKDLPALPKVRLETYHEGLSVQILHTGPYSAEGPTLERMHRVFIPQNGYEMAGKHHEIYLSDPNKAAPEKLKTILRQPVKKAAG